MRLILNESNLTENSKARYINIAIKEYLKKKGTKLPNLKNHVSSKYVSKIKNILKNSIN